MVWSSAGEGIVGSRVGRINRQKAVICGPVNLDADARHCVRKPARADGALGLVQVRGERPFERPWTRSPRNMATPV